MGERESLCHFVVQVAESLSLRLTCSHRSPDHLAGHLSTRPSKPVTRAQDLCAHRGMSSSVPAVSRWVIVIDLIL